MLAATTPYVPVTRLRAATRTDSRGDVVRSWTSPDRKAIPRATLESVNGTAADGTVIVIESERRLLIVGTFDITAADRVDADGEIWRVNGKPNVKGGFVTGTHTTVRLKRLEAV